MVDLSKQHLIFALAVTGVLAMAPAAHACRCPQRTLGDYFAAADEVFIATLEATVLDETAAVGGERQIFSFTTDAPRLKAVVGERLPYVSYRSSAACAVEAVPGAIYAVFADYDAAEGVAWLSSCNGSRILMAQGREPRGFEDVPARFVPSQLNALAGLDLLRAIAKHEPQPDDLASERLVGLLDVAALEGGKVQLHAGPNQATEVVATAVTMEDLIRRESDYEVDAGVVYAVVDGWFKLRLARGVFGWLAKEQAGTYSSFDELPVNRLSYLNEHWTGFVWPSPGAGLPVRSTQHAGAKTGRAESAARILESTRIGSSLWFRVDVLSASECESEQARVVLSGWVPAYGVTGEPAVWFYSRGC